VAAIAFFTALTQLTADDADDADQNKDQMGFDLRYLCHLRSKNCILSDVSLAPALSSDRLTKILPEQSQK